LQGSFAPGAPALRASPRCSAKVIPARGAKAIDRFLPCTDRGEEPYGRGHGQEQGEEPVRYSDCPHPVFRKYIVRQEAETHEPRRSQVSRGVQPSAPLLCRRVVCRSGFAFEARLGKTWNLLRFVGCPTCEIQVTADALNRPCTSRISKQNHNIGPQVAPHPQPHRCQA
jgi:hypothetical protein